MMTHGTRPLHKERDQYHDKRHSQVETMLPFQHREPVNLVLNQFMTRNQSLEIALVVQRLLLYCDTNMLHCGKSALYLMHFVKQQQINQMCVLTLILLLLFYPENVVCF